MLCQLFELFIGHRSGAVFRGIARIFGIHVVQGKIRGSDEDDGVERRIAGQFRFFQLTQDKFFDPLRLVFVRLNFFHKLFVQIYDADIEGNHFIAVIHRQIADFRAGAADIDERRLFVGTVNPVRDIIAIRLGATVDEVNGQTRALQKFGAYLIKVFRRTQSRRRDQVQNVYPEFGTFALHYDDRLDQFVDAAGRERFSLQIMQQRQAGTVFEHDLRRTRRYIGCDHGNAAGTDVDD